MSEQRDTSREVTSTDDMREVREALSRQFGNDVRALAAHATGVANTLADELGLRDATPETSRAKR